MSLQAQIEKLTGQNKIEFSDADFALFDDFKAALNRGAARAAERDSAGIWRVNAWVKQGILHGFRMGKLVEMSHVGETLRFFDKHTYPLREFATHDNVRIVPGGTSVRDGCFVASSVVLMPPCYINVGAFVDAGTMIDSHALVGSCAQIGKRVHISAAAQIGGVLEPVSAMPVIIEDDVLVGGNCGVYEGALVRERAVLAPGVILTGATPVYDLVRGEIYRRALDKPLEIPAGAVVVPGSRAIENEQGRAWNLSLYAPVIVKYRDEKTDRAVQLEDYLR